MFKKVLMLVVLTVSFVKAVQAVPVQWKSQNGGNNHIYEVVISPSESWGAAATIANAAGGYLVTITSAAEQQFVSTLMANSGATTGGYWMGLKESTEGVYGWYTGESMSYTNWDAGQPDNWGAGNEMRGHMLWTKTASEGFYYRRGQWNDVIESGYDGFYPPDVARAGYIIEIVPEPATVSLIVLGGLALLRRRS